MAAAPLNQYKVTLLPAKGRRLSVFAQYFRVDEAGNLAFRIAQCDSYPIMVRIFARGTWRDVENITGGTDAQR